MSIKTENSDDSTDKKPVLNASGDAPREEMDDMVDKVDSLVAQLTDSHITVNYLKAKIIDLEVSIAGVESKLLEQLATQKENANTKLVAIQKTLKAKISELETSIVGTKVNLREQLATQKEEADTKLEAMQKTLNARHRRVRRLRRCIKRAKNACGDNDLPSESDDLVISDSDDSGDDDDTDPLLLRSKSFEHLFLRVSRRR